MIIYYCITTRALFLSAYRRISGAIRSLMRARFQPTIRRSPHAHGESYSAAAPCVSQPRRRSIVIPRTASFHISSARPPHHSRVTHAAFAFMMIIYIGGASLRHATRDKPRLLLRVKHADGENSRITARDADQYTHLASSHIGRGLGNFD